LGRENKLWGEKNKPLQRMDNRDTPGVDLYYFFENAGEEAKTLLLTTARSDSRQTE